MDITPTKDALNLYTYFLCPYCKPVEYLLTANNIEFTRHELNLMKGEQKSEAYSKINPLCKVPAIIENDFVLFESNTINRYLCNSKRIQDRWYPNDSKKRALIDLYFDWHAANVNNLFKFTYAKMGWNNSITLEEAEQISQKTFAELEKIFLNRFKFIAGEEVSIADLALAWHLCLISDIGFELPARSRQYFEELVKAEPELNRNFEEYTQQRKQTFGK